MFASFFVCLSACLLYIMRLYWHCLTFLLSTFFLKPLSPQKLLLGIITILLRSFFCIFCYFEYHLSLLPSLSFFLSLSITHTHTQTHTHTHSISNLKSMKMFSDPHDLIFCHIWSFQHFIRNKLVTISKTSFIRSEEEKWIELFSKLTFALLIIKEEDLNEV